ncbi:MAG: two-component system response regulator PhoP [Gammaproteobacteria bacterium]|jgi:two-component system response regulator PhoP
MRILLVEDDIELQTQLKIMLERRGFQLNTAEDGVEALYHASEYQIDLAIVDLGLPKMDGIELIRRLREDNHHFPILILTARSGWKSKVLGLDAGADDYLTKPFQPEELAARINALIRRATGQTRTLLEVGLVTLDTTTNAVYVNQQEIDLTDFEYRLLEQFITHPGKILSRSMLIDRLYDQQDDKDSNVVEVIIARLRKKLDVEGSYRPIETLRGRGYRFKSGKA